MTQAITVYPNTWTELPGWEVRHSGDYPVVYLCVPDGWSTGTLAPPPGEAFRPRGEASRPSGDAAFQRVQAIVDEMGGPPGHTFHLDYFSGSTVMYLQHRYQRPDSLTGKMGWGRGRKWHISPHATDSEIVLTALKAMITDAEHEVREAFTYRGVHLFQPHIDVDVLAKAAQHSDVRQDPSAER